MSSNIKNIKKEEIHMNKINKQIQKEIFESLRVILIEEPTEFSKENFVKSLTFNENVKSYGFKLDAESIYAISCSSNHKELYDNFKDMLSTVNAKPMYPNFPDQVLEMDELTFRFHQMLHYASTYGRELYEGCEVLKGWLPEYKEEERLEDKQLLEYKVIKAVTVKECCDMIVSKIVEKKERFTIQEANIVKYFAKNFDLNIVEVPFKENLATNLVSFIDEDKELGKKYMLKLCKHTGDVYKIINMYNQYRDKNKNKHLSTSKKRMFVSVLESFPLNDFKNNIYQSKRIFETEIDAILRTISFTNLAKNTEFKEVVRQARNKEIKSWYSGLEKRIESKSHKEVLEYLKERPGEFLRRVFRLIKLGYTRDELLSALKDSDNYKMQTIVETIDKEINILANELIEEPFMKETISKKTGRETLIEIFKELLFFKYQNIETPLKNKKVFVDNTVFNLNESFIKTNSKGEDSSYIRGGLAFTIPEDVDILRFFVYWDDEERIDIDLHAYFETLNGGKGRIGWDASYNTCGVTHSGDITHSNAAEYIDVDMDAAAKHDVKFIKLDIYSYTSVAFKDIATIFCGMMAVSKKSKGKKMKLHDIKNEFFHHELNTNEMGLKYAYIDIENKCLRLVMQNKEDCLKGFSVKELIEILLQAQESVLVDNKDEAEVILALDRVDDERCISLLDENYFFE